MDSIWVSGARDLGSIPSEATIFSEQAVLSFFYTILGEKIVYCEVTFNRSL